MRAPKQPLFMLNLEYSISRDSCFKLFNSHYRVFGFIVDWFCLCQVQVIFKGFVTFGVIPCYATFNELGLWGFCELQRAELLQTQAYPLRIMSLSQYNPGHLAVSKQHKSQHHPLVLHLPVNYEIALVKSRGNTKRTVCEGDKAGALPPFSYTLK